MKEIVGYLLDRETGAGISGKDVEFTLLNGDPVTTTDTYAQSLIDTTDGNGKFSAKFELCPGPVNTQVTVSGTEVKIRKSDERAEFGFQWASDISRIARSVKGVIGGFKNELSVSCPSGHLIRINTGAAIFNGGVFSVEMGVMDITGTANTNPAINPRIDLVTLRQYNEDASGQLAGKQQVVVTLGSTTSTAPAIPTGANFVDFPLAEVSTAYNASTKTVSRDRRVFARGNGSAAMVVTSVNGFFGGSISTSSYTSLGSTATITGLNPSELYDGHAVISGTVSCSAGTASMSQMLFNLPSGSFWAAETDVAVLRFLPSVVGADTSGFSYLVPLVGVTGVSSLLIPIEAKNFITGGGSSTIQIHDIRFDSMLKPR